MEEETSWKLCTGSPTQAHDHSLSQKDCNMVPIRSCSCPWSFRRTVNLDSFIKGFTQPTRRMSQYYPTSIKLKTHILFWKLCKMKLDYRAYSYIWVTKLPSPTGWPNSQLAHLLLRPVGSPLGHWQCLLWC